MSVGRDNTKFNIPVTPAVATTNKPAGRLVGLVDSGVNLVGRVARVVWVARGRGPGLAALQRELADGMAAATRGATI